MAENIEPGPFNFDRLSETEALVRAANSRSEFIAYGARYSDDLLATNSSVKGMYNDFRSAGFDKATAVSKTIDAVTSGTNFPVARLAGAGEEFLRFVPSGNSIGNSPFYVSRSTYESLVGQGLKPHQIADALGMPPWSNAGGAFSGFDIYSATARRGSLATVYESQVARVSSGAYSANGGAKQSIIPSLQGFDVSRTPVMRIPGYVPRSR